MILFLIRQSGESLKLKDLRPMLKIIQIVSRGGGGGGFSLTVDG